MAFEGVHVYVCIILWMFIFIMRIYFVTLTKSCLLEMLEIRKRIYFLNIYNKQLFVWKKIHIYV